MRCQTYILEGRNAVPEPNAEKWAEWFEKADRLVAQTEVGASLVSTVFLGVDHALDDGPPMLFETMIFTDGDAGRLHRRCSTWAEAEIMHAYAVDHWSKWPVP